MLRQFLLISASWMVLLSLAHAQKPTSSPAPTSSVSPAPNATSGPTAEYTLPPDKLAKSKALYDLRVRLLIIGTIYGVLQLLFILYFGIMAKYRDWAERASTHNWFRMLAVVLAAGTFVLGGLASVKAIANETTRQKLLHAFLLLLMAWLIYRMVTRRKWTQTFAQALIAVPLLLLTTTLLDLPLDAYHHSVSLRYGLSVQSWGSWFGDVGKGFFVATVIGIVLLWHMIVIIRWSPKRWWFYFWFPAYGAFVLLIYGSPWLIDPLFNKFEPLAKDNEQLVLQIEELTQRSGLAIPRERMFLMKASEKSTELNAYVTGFGASKRIVVWDTTIQKTSTPETLFVVGHEMGHYVLNHIIYGLVLGAVGIFVALYLIYIVSGWMLQRFGARWRIRDMGDWAVLPMIFLLLQVFGFFASPIGGAVSRQMEHNADIYGLEITHGINPNPQEAGAHAFQTLGELSLVYPHSSRFLNFWYGSHPTIPDRVRFAHEYDPWRKGEQPKYVK